MRRKDVKTIIAYYYGIPGMKKLLDEEQAELEKEYNGLRGIAMDGMPHSSTPGKPTEELAERVDAGHVRNRLEVIAVRRCVLDADRETVQGCLDALKGEYKRLVTFRYRDKYSWTKIALVWSTTERTVRRWHDRAMDRLGEALNETPMPDELLDRASRARI